MKLAQVLRNTAAIVALLAAGAAAQPEIAPLDPDHPAIAYRTAPQSDRVAQLNRRLQDGQVELSFDDRTGYLRSLLAVLEIPIESQIAVYSRTSLQSALISPANPRAIYFNDSVSVGWMRGGFIEIAAHDPTLGVSFYVLPQARAVTPRLFRDVNCLGCHYSTAAEGVPGLLVRSIPTARDGRTLPWLGNYTTDHRSPFEERWGGWYVTGTHGSRPHLGNLSIADRQAQELPAWNENRVLASLERQFDTTGYLSPHSDIVALLVFEHQARMTNLLTRYGWLARMAAHAGRTATAGEELRGAASDLVDYMLFVDEAPLEGARGTSGYSERFSAAGRRDSRGRSLRDLELRTRLMRYPCSYMIYSEAFDQLPGDARTIVYRRMKEVLAGEDASPRYARLAPADRRAILEILRETKTGLPAWF